MRIPVLYAAIFVATSALLTALLMISEDPESLIVGKWREQSWEYEKSDGNGTREMGHEVKERIGKTLVIHNAEYWVFSPNRTLALWRKDGKVVTRWRLTGRANVLRLEYEGRIVEHYNVTHLSSRTLVLNFETDIQAKGIAKLTFQKMTDG